MLDDTAIDQLVRTIDPDPGTVPETDVAWARLLQSTAGQPRTRPRRIFVPVVAIAAALLVFGLVNWLPSGDGSSVPAAYARAISRGEQQLSASPGRVLYVDMVTTYTTKSGTTWEDTQSWNGEPRGPGEFGAFRYKVSGPASTPHLPASHHGKQPVAVTDVAILGGIGADYVPATDTLHVNRLPTGTSSMNFSGFTPGTPPVDVLATIYLNAKRGGEIVDTTAARLIRQFSRLPDAHVTRRSGLITITASTGKSSSTITVQQGTLRPVSATMISPDASLPHGRDVTSYRFKAWRYLSPAAAAPSFNLLRAYPNAKVITTHDSALVSP